MTQPTQYPDREQERQRPDQGQPWDPSKQGNDPGREKNPQGNPGQQGTPQRDQ